MATSQQKKSLEMDGRVDASPPLDQVVKKMAPD